MSKRKALKEEFKAFINKGNVLDMAVGVIIGSAFNAVVTALASILLSICTWGVPGGIDGLVTVLPAVNETQKGMDIDAGLGQTFEISELQSLSEKETIILYGTSAKDNPELIETVKSSILEKYTLHGTTYTYNNSSVINWGAFINAVISFLIISLTLFVIIKVVNKLKERRTKLEAKFEKINNKISDKLDMIDDKIEDAFTKKKKLDDDNVDVDKTDIS